MCVKGSDVTNVYTRRSTVVPSCCLLVSKIQFLGGSGLKNETSTEAMGVPLSSKLGHFFIRKRLGQGLCGKNKL